MLIKWLLKLYQELKKINCKSKYEENVNEENLKAYYCIDMTNKLSWVTALTNVVVLHICFKSTFVWEKRSFNSITAVCYMKSDSEYNSI